MCPSFFCIHLCHVPLTYRFHILPKGALRPPHRAFMTETEAHQASCRSSPATRPASSSTSPRLPVRIIGATLLGMMPAESAKQAAAPAIHSHQPHGSKVQSASYVPAYEHSVHTFDAQARDNTVPRSASKSAACQCPSSCCARISAWSMLFRAHECLLCMHVLRLHQQHAMSAP